MNIYKIAKDKGYVIDAQGVVSSKTKKSLKLWEDTHGYYTFTIRIKRKTYNVYVHRFQAYFKYGEEVFTPGIVVRHLDGNSKNNSFENIAIGSQSDNMMDIPEQLRYQSAKRASSFMKKYNHQQIIDYYNQCHSYAQCMKKFNISSKGTLHWILKNSDDAKNKNT